MSAMDAAELVRRFEHLTTPHLADACIRAGVPVRCGPTGMRPVITGDRMIGRVLPARHAGSVDVFLEALESSRPGDVLVADNAGRLDESCVGDLMTLEAKAAGLAGIAIWGLHRDSREIAEIGLPVFSLGALPTGPLRLDPREPDALQSAAVGSWTVTRDDIIAADDDGVLFVPSDSLERLLEIAETIRDTERAQAERISAGVTLRLQVHFADYLLARESNPGLTLRDHLAAVGGAIEV